MNLEIFLWCWQFLLLFAVVLGWLSMHHVLRQRYEEKYTRLQRSKQIYIVKNVVKSIFLACISPLALYGISRVAFYNVYESTLFRIFGCVYISSDVVGLLVLNRNLPRSTILHHICVIFFGYHSIMMDYSDQQNDPFRQIGMLGAISALTWPVNTHLGLRSLLSKKDEIWLRRVSLMVYAPAIAASAAWQLAAALPSIALLDATGLYGAAVLLIFYDDLNLLSFLSRSQNRGALIFFCAMMFPCIAKWNAGRVAHSALFGTTMMSGIATVCFESSTTLDVLTLFLGCAVASSGFSDGDTWTMTCARSYLFFCIVAFQIMVQGHKIMDHFVERRRDPDAFFAGAIFFSSVLQLL